MACGGIGGLWDQNMEKQSMALSFGMGSYARWRPSLLGWRPSQGVGPSTSQLVHLVTLMTREGVSQSFDPEPWLDSLEDGSKVTVAGKAWFFDQHREAYHCSTMLHGQKFLLQGLRLKLDRFALFRATKVTQHGMTYLDAKASEIHFQEILHSEDANDIIDVCSGYAVMTAGYHLLNCKVRCHVEINPRYVTWLRSRKTPVIEGDIDDVEVQIQLIPFMEKPGILTGGFSCQPFSQLGDQKQQLDPRARSFEGLVTTCYLFQPAAMILECTKEAMTSPWVQSSLSMFSQLTGYSFQQQICHLHEFWPAKRTRWWAILVHPNVRMPPLQSFPSLDFKPSFRHLLPKLASWPMEHVQELQLTALELEVFADQPGGIGSNAVNPTKPLQTALHAWGSQLTACACGCRAGGFTPKRLEEKGLYGALIPAPGQTMVRRQDVANMRHIHPDEVAVLHLVPTRHLQAEDRHLRLDLTALGQMASPAHALWHVAQVIQAFGNAFGAPTHHALAEQGLLRLAVETFAARDDMLQPFTHSRESALFQTAILAKFGVQYEAQIPQTPLGEDVRSYPAQSTQGALTRKAVDNGDAPFEDLQVVSPTGGLEFFANRSTSGLKTHAPILTDCSSDRACPGDDGHAFEPDRSRSKRPSAAETSLASPLSSSGEDKHGRSRSPAGQRYSIRPGMSAPNDPPLAHVTTQGRSQNASQGSWQFKSGCHTEVHQQPPNGKGKGGNGASHMRPSWPHPAVEPHPAQDSNHAQAPPNRVDPGDDQSQGGTIKDFQITVCCKGSQPTRVQVRSGATVGQLSQAEEQFASFAQPIAVTTMTGVPCPEQ